MNLSIKNLSKIYKNKVKALDDLSLEIGTGMFGLLGPNGAGKSTLMRTVATLQDPTSGSLFFNDINILQKPQELRKILGYLPQEFGVYPKENATQLLDYFSILKGVSSKKERHQKVEEVLHLTNLWEVRKKKVSTYSGGMRQRFGIAQLLLNNPKLIIVDEPTAGLDPGERNRFLNVLRDISSNNLVIFSTHLVEDVSDLCTDLAIINNGQLIARTKPQLAVTSLRGRVWIKKIDKEQLDLIKNKYLLLSQKFDSQNDLIIKVYAEEKPDPSFTLGEANLEDYYFLKLNQSA